ncbi:MAG: DUF429 domain-containing protein [Thermoplasmata archaeon]|nr:MAG: DUF429 domain-containing protein [Thermoplasmata archaeon]RLF31285.1 MAG: DUF429 domain-containing protein [Thermoplasmata archaeon]
MDFDGRPEPPHRVMGIDLAALPKNPTGLCTIGKTISLSTVYGDQEILSYVHRMAPDMVAVDAPLMEEIRVREADRLLKKYGAMPPTMPSMALLTERARRIVTRLKAPVIEVFPTASAKILGIYEKNWRSMAEKIGIPAQNKHELDAYLAAYTAYLFTIGKAEKVGGAVVIPKVF